ncbi:MAG: GxxExxY protein [Armatimonadetes bacterium]|nr:GxxExxY protein [Armatimonadota bacterium]
METRKGEMRKSGPGYQHTELTSRILACAVEVHKSLGPGFEETFYQRALHRELTAAGLDAVREVDIEVHYKELVLGKKRADFVVEQCEVKRLANSGR